MGIFEQQLGGQVYVKNNCLCWMFHKSGNLERLTKLVCWAYNAYLFTKWLTLVEYGT
jgi:hypothetical protein